MESEFLKTDEAAVFLGRSQSTLRRDRSIGHLGIPYYQEIVGRKRVVYSRAELKEWQAGITKPSNEIISKK